MIKKIKKYLCKEELLEIQKEKLLIEIIKQSNFEIKKDLDDREKRFREEKKFFEESYKKRFNEDFIKEIEAQKKNLKNIIDFDLIPWNEIWSICPMSQKPVKIKIEQIIISNDCIEIIADKIFKQWQYFKTEKEAIDFYNNYLEKLKI